MNASGERFLITGALGCIGAWSCAQLVREDVPVVVYDLGTNTERLELVMSPEELDRLEMISGDVTDLGQLERTIADHGITHVVHLAAMLLPLVKADPARGASVNVVGTTNVFEAAKRHGVRGVVYASSAAVYGPDAGPRVEDAGDPTSLYGVFKLANEKQLTDVLAAIEQGKREVSEVVAAIDAVAPEMSGRITFNDVQLPFPEEMESGGLEEVIGPMARTPLEEGTRATIEHYRGRVAA